MRKTEEYGEGVLDIERVRAFDSSCKKTSAASLPGRQQQAIQTRRRRSRRAGKQLIRPGRVYSLGRRSAGITEYLIGAIEIEMMQIHESPRPAESRNEMVEDILYEGSVSARNPR